MLCSVQTVSFYFEFSRSNIGPLLKILNQIEKFSPFSEVTIVVSTVLLHPVRGLCGRLAVVFFQYLVGYSVGGS